MSTSSRTSTTSRLARTTLACLAVATAAATTAAGLTVASAGADTPTTRIDPERLDRGEDSSAPYVWGRTIVEDGTVTRVRGAWFQLLGTRPDGRYVVLVSRDGSDQVRAYTPGGGGRKILGDTYGAEPVLSRDGTTLVTAGFKNRPRRHTLLRAYDSTTGERLGSRKRQGALTALDADTTTVVYSGEDGPVVRWDLVTDSGARISPRYGYRADLRTDRLAVFTKDPYEGGCTVVSLLSDPGTELWRSCEEAVRAFSPDGNHVITTHKLADGLGPSEVRVRTVEGEERGHYRVDGYVGQMLFEDASTSLLEAVTRDSSALVRCSGADCELASDIGEGAPWS